MKQMGILMLAAALILSGCAKKTENFALKEGTPAYEFAKELATIVPALGPDMDTVLVEAKGLRITAAQVIQAIRDNMGTRTDQLKSVDAGQLKKLIDQAATSLAERKLLLTAAAAAKTTVPAEDLEKALQSEYSRRGSEQAFLEALKSADISIEHVKKNIQETLVINTFLSRIAEGAAKVSEDELRAAYKLEAAEDKTATVRHILILTEGKSDQEKAEARTKIEDILAQAKAGADFTELAKEYSEDPGSKDKGGLYEDFPRGQMVKPFEDAAFTVPVGELSGVVETTFGYHILKIVDRKKETRPFEEIRAELESKLRQGKQGTTVQEYVQKLKEKAKFKFIGL